MATRDRQSVHIGPTRDDWAIIRDQPPARLDAPRTVGGASEPDTGGLNSTGPSRSGTESSSPQRKSSRSNVTLRTRVVKTRRSVYPKTRNTLNRPVSCCFLHIASEEWPTLQGIRGNGFDFTRPNRLITARVAAEPPTQSNTEPTAYKVHIPDFEGSPNRRLRPTRRTRRDRGDRGLCTETTAQVASVRMVYEIFSGLS